ncbi:MAG TPA: hypothetical protein VF950_25160 [Planctomycetota bacterium]
MFDCPGCRRPELQVRSSFDLGGDDAWDEVALQILSCPCGFRAVGVYQESRRGALDSECVDHRGYRADDERLREAEALIRDRAAPGARDLLGRLGPSFGLSG